METTVVILSKVKFELKTEELDEVATVRCHLCRFLRIKYAKNGFKHFLYDRQVPRSLTD